MRLLLFSPVHLFFGSFGCVDGEQKFPLFSLDCLLVKLDVFMEVKAVF